MQKFELEFVDDDGDVVFEGEAWVDEEGNVTINLDQLKDFDA